MLFAENNTEPNLCRINFLETAIRTGGIAAESEQYVHLQSTCVQALDELLARTPGITRAQATQLMALIGAPVSSFRTNLMAVPPTTHPANMDTTSFEIGVQINVWSNHDSCVI